MDYLEQQALDIQEYLFVKHLIVAEIQKINRDNGLPRYYVSCNIGVNYMMNIVIDHDDDICINYFNHTSKYILKDDILETTKTIQETKDFIDHLFKNVIFPELV